MVFLCFVHEFLVGLLRFVDVFMASPYLHVFALDIIVFRQMSTVVVPVGRDRVCDCQGASKQLRQLLKDSFFHNELFVKPKAI